MTGDDVKRQVDSMADELAVYFDHFGEYSMADRLKQLRAALAPCTVLTPEERDSLIRAVTQENCNGCGTPKRRWGPYCPGMTQGDATHFHSPSWWLDRLLSPDEAGDE